jgi:IS5 family transposase
MRFLNLGRADVVPDASTIWTFREALTRAKIEGKSAIVVLFARFDVALAKAGYLAMSGQIIDASIVAKAAQYGWREARYQGRRHPAEWTTKPAKLRQKDRDARWTVKCTKAKPSEESMPRVDLAVPAFGYKNHIGIDRRHRLIRRWTVTDTARHDGSILAELIDKNNTASDVWPIPPIALGRTRSISPTVLCVRRSIERNPRAKRCRAAPRKPMPASRRCARQSSMTLPGRKGRWVCSFVRSAWPERQPRSVSPTLSKTCSEWCGSRTRSQ